MSLDADADIVEIIIRKAQAEGLDADAAHQIEMAIRQEFGGMRVRIPKRKKHPSPEVREQAFVDGLSNMSTKEVTEKNGISRATLYRLMKRGAK